MILKDIALLEWNLILESVATFFSTLYYKNLFINQKKQKKTKNTSKIIGECDWIGGDDILFLEKCSLRILL